MWLMLTEPQKLIRRAVRQFAQRELAPTAAERDRTARFPAEAFAAMGRLGFLGMVVPEGFGGAGADYVSYALAVMEIAAADGATSTSFQVHNSLTCLQSCGTEPLSRRSGICGRSLQVNSWARSVSPNPRPGRTPLRSKHGHAARGISLS